VKCELKSSRTFLAQTFLSDKNWKSYLAITKLDFLAGVHAPLVVKLLRGSTLEILLLCINKTLLLLLLLPSILCIFPCSKLKDAQRCSKMLKDAQRCSKMLKDSVGAMVINFGVKNRDVAL